MKLLFIVNPKSGIRKKIDIEGAIRTASIDSFSYDIALTERKKHASELAAKAVEENYDGVVAVGGDGTINECAHSLLNTNIPLGIIPMGSGNGLARHLKISLDIDKGLATIKRGKTWLIDTCTFNEHFFVSNAGLGFVAAVAGSFDKNNTRRGFTGYALHTLSAFLKFKTTAYEIVADGTVHKGEYFAVNICNTNQFGYEAKISPRSDIADGLLDMVLIKKTNFFNYNRIMAQLFVGNVLNNSAVEYIMAKNIEIKALSPSPSQVDGEPFGMVDTVKAKVMPSSLKLFVP